MSLNWSEIGVIVASFIVSLGGGGAIVFGLSKWIGNILADMYVERAKGEIQQEIESYKTQLKKSEFLFQKEFEAASQFISLHRRFLPRYPHPDDPPYEPYRDFACNLGEVEKALRQYVETYGIALQKDVLNRLATTIGKASAGKYEVGSEDMQGPVVSEDGYRLVDEVLKELKEIESELWEAVRSQSST